MRKGDGAMVISWGKEELLGCRLELVPTKGGESWPRGGRVGKRRKEDEREEKKKNEIKN